MIQFTVRWMLAATAIIALLCGGLFAFPAIASASLACMLIVAVPAALVCCVVYGRAGLRAYALGALVPYTMRLFVGSPTMAGIKNAVFSPTRIVPLGSRYAYQANPTRPVAESPDTMSFFTRAYEALGSVGHALMAEEAMILSASIIAGLAALATWWLIRPRAA